MSKLEWTPSKLQSFIKGVLRKGSTRWPPKYEVLNASKRGKAINAESGRLAEHYQCAQCMQLFPAKLVVVDHISPVVPVTGFISWDDVIARMFCSADGLQVLCKTCHGIKSKQENAERRENKKKTKL